ncbi:hypothetical protein ACE193_15435 [Bernardetia sp. OM2101]|uniref:hypothetical protein n=1 Tax=Bernardetia sp. OM2101 TaxID=3344876 RepID=UPI0035D04086
MNTKRLLTYLSSLRYYFLILIAFHLEFGGSWRGTYREWCALGIEIIFVLVLLYFPFQKEDSY